MSTTSVMFSKPALDLAVEKAVARERERCAKIAEAYTTAYGVKDGEIYVARKIADGIRRR